jgi:hypothetical protein
MLCASRRAGTGGLKPYVLVRGRLEALVLRALFYDLVALGTVQGDWFGVWSSGKFWPMKPARDIGLDRSGDFSFDIDGSSGGRAHPAPPACGALRAATMISSEASGIPMTANRWQRCWCRSWHAGQSPC